MRRRWAINEITTILERYPHEVPKRLALELGRTENSISSQARRYGQKTPRHSYQRIRDSVPYKSLLESVSANSAVSHHS